MTTPSKRRDKTKDLALVGTTIAGKYRVIQLLGQGGFGSVFLVEIISGMVGERLALKLIPTEFCGDEKIKAQFLNEIRVAMRMVNKYIVQIRDVGDTESGQLYYTMDYCPGETLGDILKREGKISPARAVPILLRVLDALKTAHAAGVIHRDLKPANVMVFQQDSHETVRVLDFGIATALRGQTSGGSFLGSPHYMPPEQFLNEELGLYTDTYSVGVILYECVTGQKPYRGRTAQEVYNDLKKRPVMPPVEVNPDLAAFPELSKVICRSVERNPELRYPTAKDFFNDLKTSLEPKAEPAPAPAAPPPPRRRRPPVSAVTRAQTSKASGTAIGIGAGLGVLAVVLFFIIKNAQTGSSGPQAPAPNAPPVVITTQPPAPPPRVDPAPDDSGKSEIEEPTPLEPPRRAGPEEKVDVSKVPAPPSDPEANARRSRELLAEAVALAKKGDDWTKVRDITKDVIELNYADPEGHRLKGMAELELHQFEDALRSLEDTRSRTPPEKVDAGLLLALLEAQAGLSSPNPEAIARLESEAIVALKKDPRDCDSAVKLLGRLDKGGRESDVLLILSQAEAQNCKDPFIEEMHQEYLVRRPNLLDEKVQEIYKNAKAAFDGDDFAQAALKAEEGFKLKPIPELGFLLADSYNELKKPKALLAALGDLAKVVGEDSEALIRVGILYGKGHLDDFEASQTNKAALDKALMNLNAAIDILAKEPKNKFPNHTAAARTYRARCYAYQLGSLSKVDEEVKSAVSRDLALVYHQSESYYLLGERVNEPDRSAAFLKVIWRLPLFLEGKDTSRDSRGPFLMGRAYLKLGKPDNFTKAINYFLSAERMGMKGRPELYNAMGDAYLGLGEIIKAAQRYRDSFNALPTEEACEKSATCFIKVNNRASAENILMDGLKSFSASKTLKQLLDSSRR